MYYSRAMLMVSAAATSALVACGEEASNRGLGGAATPADAGGGPPVASGPAFLSADPAQLGFDCTAIGCRQNKVVTLTNTGAGELLISRVDLALGSSRDYSLSPTALLPARVAPNAFIEVVVLYIPTDALVDRATMSVEFGNASGGAPQTLQVEIEARSFGSPTLVATPADLNFGYVARGTRGTAPVTLQNTSVGTTIISLTSASFAPAGPFRLETNIPPIILLNPGQSQALNIFFEPVDEGVFSTALTIQATSGDQAVPAVTIAIRATTFEQPTVTVTPTSLAFPTILKGENRSIPLEIRNSGAAGLQILGLALAPGASTAFSMNPTQPPTASLATGQTFRTNVDFTPQAAGTHAGEIVVTTNDPQNATVRISLSGRAVWPLLEITPATIDFGQFVRSWTSLPQNVVLKNKGVGPLEIQQIAFGPGSTSNFAFVGTMPLLPRSLNENETLTLQVQYVAGTLGLETGNIRVVSTDAAQPTQTLNMSATGVTCEQGCPLQHATPRCDRGACEIASCATGWDNTDGITSSGCECAIESDEASGFCSAATWKGSISDDPSQSATITGKLTLASDVDWYNVFAVDNGGWGEIFGDDFKVRVRVTQKPSAYPIRVCVYHVNRGSHQAICSTANEQCGDDVSWGGSYGSGDDADVFIRVSTSSSRTSCESYTIVVSNG